MTLLSSCLQMESTFWRAVEEDWLMIRVVWVGSVTASAQMHTKAFLTAVKNATSRMQVAAKK